jgi:RimJ/RimL family protein N-acetyltransferase
MLFTLTGGSQVWIRPIRPTDKRLLADGLALLSEDTIHKRFLSPKPSLSRAELRYLTELDGQDHFALIAVRADDGTMAGVARFVRLPDQPETAEAAITVGDCLQGEGLGRQLAVMLADAARERGIERITATMLSDNVPAHRLMATIAERLSTGPHEGGAHELTLDLVA